MLGSEQTNATYVIPGRTLTGSAQHVVEQLDEIVASLLAFRQIVAARKDGDVRKDSRQTGSPPTAR